MVTIRSVNELISSMVDFFRLNQPDMDTKNGSVARDLFIEAPAGQLSLVYDELSKISDVQSLILTVGADLDNLASNYGAVRKAAVQSSGIALLTFASIPAAIAINKGALVFSSNGTSFSIQTGSSVIPTFLNLYRAIGTKYRNELDFLGISDQYAIEVPVTCSTSGVLGNISKYGLTRTSIPGVSNVTNITPFFGGANSEDDAKFRSRVLSIFSGSNVGTALGYKNIVTADSQVTDALVIQPGDSLMVRDGTQVVKNSDGSFTIISEGQGGKVDIIILGLRPSDYIDSFIYRDKSNKNDPTDLKNIFVLGQIAGDENKTVSRRRLDNLANNTLPAQPVENLVQITGSLSGGNFLPKSVDSLGRVTGNYELIKDTGVYAGSPFGFDKFHWISDHISLLEEDKIKGKINGQDAVNFSDVISISAIKQNISIQNENSIISNNDRSIVQLLHTPATNVTRVFNLTTGERYTVVNQNLDSNGSTNPSGRIVITGNTLPSPSDLLQVDYTWIVDYDPYVDFDGRLLLNNPRVVTDSVDWGYSNAIRNERSTFTLSNLSTFYSGTTLHPINNVISTSIFNESDGYVTTVTSGLYANKLAITITGLSATVLSIDGVVEKNTQKEIFATAQNDGSFSVTQIISGGIPTFTLQIILPTDSSGLPNDIVTVKLNKQDVFTVSGVSGNFTDKTITVPASNYSGGSSFVAEVNYIANVQDLLSVKLSELPVTKNGNGFTKGTLSLNTFNNSTVTYIKEYQTVSTGPASLRLNVNSTDYILSANQVATVVRVGDGAVLWSSSVPGTVTVGTDGNYVLNLPGTNAPITGDNALIVYSATDVTNTQPMTFNTGVLSVWRTSVLSGQQDYYVSVSLPVEIGATQAAVIRISDGVELTDADAIITSGSITFSPAKQTLVIGNEQVIVLFFNNKVLRQTPTRIAATLSDQFNNSGILTINGVTVTKAKEIVFTAINTGLQQNISEAVRKFLLQSSIFNIDPSLSVARMVKVENVTMSGSDVVSVNATYDVKGTEIRNALYFPNESIENLTLGSLDFILPASTNNISNLPQLGDKLRATFYISNSADSENLFFTRNGTVYGNKFFALIKQVITSSGFSNGATGKITLSSLNQPSSGTRYKVFYDYLAPKPSERVVIRFNYNKLIGDSTLTLEPQRPINADVLIKAAQEILVNVSLAIVVKPEFISSATIVKQNIKDKVISAISTNTLADIIDSSDLLNVAYSVAGVDRVRVTAFNIDQAIGQVLSLTAQKNQYFVPNTIIVTIESR